jgi:integrase
MARPRSHNAGSITPKGPGRWVVRLQLGKDATGKRVREHRTIRGTRRDAQRHLNKLTSRIEEGLPAAPTQVTLGAWAATCLKNWKGSKAPRTMRDYEQIFRRIFAFDRTLGGTPISPQTLTHERVQQFIDALKHTKKRKQVKGKKGWFDTDAALSPRTIRIYHGALRTLMSEAVRLRMVPYNVVSLVRPPALQRPDRMFLTAEQANQLLDAAAESRFHALFATLLLAGLRPGEAFGLKWSDLDGRELRIQRALVWLPGKNNPPIFANTKTGRARTVVIWDRLTRILERHRAAQTAWQKELNGAYKDQDLVFASEVGGPLQLRNVVMRHFKPLLRRAALPNIRLYDLRHAYATLSHAAGVDVKVIQERLGHASITLTLDTYVHVSPGMQEKAAESLDALLTSAKAARAGRLRIIQRDASVA